MIMAGRVEEYSRTGARSQTDGNDVFWLAAGERSIEDSLYCHMNHVLKTFKL